MPDQDKLENALQQLLQIAFPELQRPAVKGQDDPTEELVKWSARMYCYSLISHFREMLGSFIWAAKHGLIPASFVIGRCLFEMAAHAYYVHKHCVQYADKSDWGAAWDFLQDINMGSRYMREEYGEENYEATPREIAKIIRCFDEWIARGRATTEYSFLSEFAHPNMAALSHYYRIDQGPSGLALVTFSAPNRNVGTAPWPQASLSFTACLHFALKMLERMNDGVVADQVKAVLVEANQ